MSKKGREPSFREWIGLRRDMRFENAVALGHAVGFAIFAILASIIVGGVATIYHFLAEVLNANADHNAIRNIGLILVAITGAPFIFWRATVAQKQANTAEQSHITDQINKAVSGLGADKLTNKIGRPYTIYMGKSDKITRLVHQPDSFALSGRSLEVDRYHDTSMTGQNGNEVFDGLHIDVQTWDGERTEIEWQGGTPYIEDGEAIAKVGDWSVFSETLPNIEVRIGAIYALERISQDSPRDHVQIMEILSAYVRGNAPVDSLEPTRTAFMPARLRSDIQAAVDVIGRRSTDLVALEHNLKYRLDLRNVDLSGGDLSRGSFEGAIFYGSRLEATNFRQANLKAARFNKCLLNHADFFSAEMRGAILDYAIVNELSGWNSSISMAANTIGITLAGADISAIGFMPIDETHSPTLGTKDTRLGSEMRISRDNFEDDISQTSYLLHGIKVEDEEPLRERLKQAGFLYWSPYDSNDAATGEHRAKLWSDLGFKGFPYEDS